MFVTNEVEATVEPDGEAVENTPDVREPSGLRDDAVEFVAVDDQQPAAVHGFVDAAVADRDAAEFEPVVIAREAVVIAGDVRDLAALSCAPQDFLKHIVVLLRPEPAAFERPAVEHIADEVKLFGLVMLEEIENAERLRFARAEMKIGNPDCSVGLRVFGLHATSLIPVNARS